MSREERAARWAALAASGLVRGELPAATAMQSPWYVRLMLGIAGWIGAMFLFLFAGAFFTPLFESFPAALTVGTMLCVGAGRLLRRKSANDFVAQFGFAVSIAGQALILMGFTRWFGSMNLAIAWTMAVVQAALFVLVPNVVHRVWTAATGSFLVAWGFGELGLLQITPALVAAVFAWVWLREFDAPAQGGLIRSAGYGLAVTAAVVSVLPSGWWTRAPSLGPVGYWLGTACSAALIPWLAVHLLRREGVPLVSDRGRAALAGAAILAVTAWKAPGIGPGVSILLLGFASGHRVLAGFGLLALVAYLVRYYYALDVTLLAKSALLAGAGAALLLARLAVLRAWPADAAAEPHRA